MSSPLATRLVASAAVAAFIAGHPVPGAVDAGKLRQGPPADAAVEAAFERLTPLERVGQLFLVAFSTSSDDEPLADALDLVRELRVGGLVLQKGNAVFANARGEDLPTHIAEMTAELQRAALSEEGPGVPLLIAVDHEGDGDPTTHLREGFTAVPSAMTIGATWEPENASAVGVIVGRELSEVGVNLLLGPSLDVLAEPRVDSRGDIGTRSFGGDPYWVAEMGRAYIVGVHHGSAGRVATVAKHFPGHGGSDRLPDEEVATVNKSLSELRRIELPPFAAVTDGGAGGQGAGSTDGEGTGSAGVSDALMTSHIRYRGFQGDNIRSGTRPVSIDPEALQLILRLDGFPFRSWRDAGGLIVADSLGVRAIRRYDDPTGDTFRHRVVARQALEAGNDCLILAQFATTPAWSVQRENVFDVVQYFARQYDTDAEFRDRVDDAARRVVRAKLALYTDWRAEVVAVPAAPDSARVGSAESRDRVAEISRQAVTLLRGDELPRPGSKITIITDDSGRLECEAETCGLPPERLGALPAEGGTLVGSILMERFGPAGTGALRSGDVAEIRFCQLEQALAPAPVATPQDGPVEPGQGPSVPPGEGCPDSPLPDRVLAQLAASDWIVFAFADLRPAAVRDLTGHLMPAVSALAQPSGARLAALSFGPPYYIDSTNFAHLDVFIAAYSKIPASIEAALEVFMGERGAVGASPVTIRDADYDLGRQLEPDPAAGLMIGRLDEDAPDSRPSDAELPAHVLVVVGPVIDRNGNPVPDDTEVELSASPGGALAGEPVVARTVDGKATAELVLPTGGLIEISATSGGAASSRPLVLSLPVPTPTPVPTIREPLPTSVTGGARVAAGDGAPGAAGTGPAASDMLLALSAIVLIAGAGTTVGERRRRSPERLLRTLLIVTAGGLAGYVAAGAIIVLGLSARWPALGQVDTTATTVAVLAGSLTGACIGLAADLWGGRVRHAAQGPGGSAAHVADDAASGAESGP